jgi:hypothetical protein
MQKLFRRHIALPQDHGSWVFLFSPLLIGLFAGHRFTMASLAVTFGALAAFLIRQPLTILVKIYSGRRAQSELFPACFWLVIYGIIGLFAAIALLYLGFAYVLFLAIPAIPIFAWHMYLVARRAERRQAGVEILATGVLALVAPAAYWTGIANPNLIGCPANFMPLEWGVCVMTPIGWWLWILAWFQSGASIVYAYLRLEQREWSVLPNVRERFKAGFQAIAWTTFNFGISLAFSAFRVLPSLIFLPFLLQWIETLWGTTHPAMGAKPVAIGMRQLMVSVLFTFVFILTWG